MKKNSKRPLTPKLRFPEFQINGKWNSDLIGGMATISKGRGISKADIAEDGITPCIRYAELYTLYGEVINEVRSRTNIAPDELVLSQPEDVILPASGETRADIARAACVLRAGVALGSDLNILRSNLHGPFFSYLLNSPLRYKIAHVAQGDTVAHLYPSQISKISIAFPTPPEQQKIADCLGLLEGLIAAEGRKLAGLRDHKRGLMQHLFPQPGETQPRLRFPKFRDKGEWEEQPFEALYDFRPNNNYSREQLNYEDGTVKNIHYGDIHTHFCTHFHINAEEVPFVNAEVLPNDLNPEAICRPGDVIFADASEDLADVGKCIEIVNVMGEQVLSGSHTILARPRAQSLVVGFGGYLFRSRSSRAGIEKEAQGTKVMQISPKRLATIKLFFPSDKNEQQAIADCLNALDDRIAAQAAKIDSLKTHKRGLMQQLFPAPEEQ